MTHYKELWQKITVSLLLGGLTVGFFDATAKADESMTVSTFGLATKQMNSDVLTPFAKANNVTLRTQFGDSNARMTQLEHNPNSGVDVVELSQNNALSGNQKHLFKKLDFSKLKNFKRLTPAQQKLAKETNSVPYTLNSVGIMYNPQKISINSWKQLWSSKLKDKLAIPDITTTFGPAMIYLAGEHAGTAVEKDNGQAAFKALSQLKPNVTKTYSQSSDIANMFKTGEIDAAVVGDYAVNMVQKANPQLKYVVPASGTLANYDTVSILKSSHNTEKDYRYIDARLSATVQKKVASPQSLNNAPVNKTVQLSVKDAENKTVGTVAKRAKSLNFAYVNHHLAQWVTRWNQLMNKQ
ncbi:ABC transporter periplasmic spermidine putrescine-binding protein PotD [Furfurilactobacillus rossiae]|uniref:ABC transporter substrate-binding protein n=1 Tax=Furfurilactobacillus rossiae TaxID=231049 RepID=UPI0015BFFEBF|nr:extracellular solute-binding protein [Furfurilactobacillus rossiae]MCF6165198.1 extracellular solute-binding protein [Furfurilactobacillus rossiae]QLE65323.1 ABC transporter periplasmic spermidine putrescine-binding protein PotD [Furfurilactobacillus rossiae]